MNSIIPNNTLLPNSKDKLLPNRDDLQTFLWVVFSYLDPESFVPLRSFPEKGSSGNSNGSRPPSNIWIRADENIVGNAFSFAGDCNKAKTATYVIPGIVAKVGAARSDQIIAMQVLLVDIDDGNTEAKLATLESALGEATLIVESGGITNCDSPKLHIYWQLTKPAIGDELKTLLDLRHKLALAIGGDIHFKSAHQPIRVAGSIYYKGGTAKAVKIRSYSCMEYELKELIKGVEGLEEERSYLCSLGTKNNTQNAFNKLNKANTKTSALSFNDIILTEVREGGSGEHTRFNCLSKVIGHWLWAHHDGRVSKEEAIERIYCYNQARVLPPWPEDKLNNSIQGIWEAHVKKNGELKTDSTAEQKGGQKMIRNLTTNIDTIKIFSLEDFLNDDSALPEDIIAPRILTPGGMLVFGGAPKVGKSDFLLSLFTHLAAGREFIGFTPPKPLKIFYLQAEINYCYLKERLQNMKLSKELTTAAKGNLYITSDIKLLLDENNIEILVSRIQAKLLDKPDIIAIDPIRNVFDGGRIGATENDNDAMIFFLQQRVEQLRDKINPNAGIILVHHTKKMTKAQFDEDPFQAFSGASSLRGYYSSGVLLHKPDAGDSRRELIFELRNGGELPNKTIYKNDANWYEQNNTDKRIAYEHKGKLYDKERDRRLTVIIEILKAEALKGRFYLMKQFAQKFQNHRELGGNRRIYEDCSVGATQGRLKFFDNPEIYGKKLILPTNASFGFMCCEDMKIKIKDSINNNTGEISTGYISVIPTHYKDECDGSKRLVSTVENQQVINTHLAEEATYI